MMSMLMRVCVGYNHVTDEGGSTMTGSATMLPEKNHIKGAPLRGPRTYSPEKLRNVLQRDAMLARYTLLWCPSVCHKSEFYEDG